MIRSTFRAIAFGVPIALALAIPVPVAASVGGDFLYPSATTHCTSGDSLQSCINFAGDGGKVEIATNAEIAATVTLSTSFTLTSASGFHGDVDIVDVNLPAGSQQVFVTDLDGQSVRVEAAGGHPPQNITLDGLHEAGNSDHAGAEITVDGGATVTLERSILGPAGFGQGMNVLINDNPSSFNGVVSIRGNFMSQGSQGPGIWVINSGSTLTDIYNNSIWGAGGSALGGLYVRANDGTSTLNIVGNSIDSSDSDGVHIVNNISSGHAQVEMFNNIISHTTGAAVSIESLGSSPALTLDAGYNDYFADAGSNHLEGRSLGAHNLALNPNYVNRPDANLKLKSTSKLINKGIVCSPGGVAITDAAGKNWLKGATVDMGAYEFGAGVVTGVALVGASGNDTLIGSAGNDIICGLAGLDVVNGSGGNDYVDGGAGNDTVIGGPGSDRLFGEVGNDLLCANDGVKGNDHLIGGPGTDSYAADAHDILASVETKRSGCG